MPEPLFHKDAHMSVWERQPDGTLLRVDPEGEYERWMAQHGYRERPHTIGSTGMCAKCYAKAIKGTAWDFPGGLDFSWIDRL